MSITILGMPVTSAHETAEIQSYISDRTNKIFITDYNITLDGLAHLVIDEENHPTFEITEIEEGYNFLTNNFTLNNYSQKSIDDNANTAYLMEDPIYSVDAPMSFNNRVLKLKNILQRVQADNPDKEVIYLVLNNPYKFCGAYVFIERLKRLIGNTFELKLVSPKLFLPSNITEDLNKFLELKHLFNVSWKYDANYMVDPSGWFVPNDNPFLITDTTDKSLTTLIDERALSFSNLEKPPVIMWSGGIDSNAVLAAFVKNNIPFKITINEKARNENPEMYDHIVNNYETVTLNERLNLTESGITDELIITGSCGDQLFPGAIHNSNLNTPNLDSILAQNALAEYEEYFNTPVDDSLKYNNAESHFKARYKFMYGYSDEEAQSYWDNYLKPKTDNFPFELKHWYQLKHYIIYIFQFEDEKHFYANNYSGQYDADKIIPFFGSDDFARWANTHMDYNFETYSQHYTQYKYPLKQYAYDVLGIESILTKVKNRTSYAN